MTILFDELVRIIELTDAQQKCAATHALHKNFEQFQIIQGSPAKPIPLPGYPEPLQLVAPGKVKRRSTASQAGRNRLMHAIAHIEFNAINMALDAAYRFRDQPTDYYRDWIKVADDEARHFSLVEGYLNDNDCGYGDFTAHNGLWEMAVQTANDVVARMALVPRVLEARGLDVTPAMIERLSAANDQAAVAILEVIYHDEIGHVEIGSKWFFAQCSERGLEPRETFLAMVDQHLHGELRGPFNVSARLRAGFDEIELAALDARSSAGKAKSE